MVLNADEILDTLRAIGLGRKEVDVYLALVFSGPLNAREVAERAKIQYPKIYTILKKLEKLGFIEKDNSRPALYYAKHPDTVWAYVKEACRRKIDRIEKELLPILREAYRSEVRTLSPFRRVGVLQGINDVKTKLVEVLAESQGEILVALPFKNILSDEVVGLLKAKARVGKLRALISEDLTEVFKEVLSEGGEVRVKDKMFGGGVVGSHVVLLLIRYGGSYIGIWSDHDFFIHIARVYFQHLWDDSKPLIGITKD